MTDEARPEPKIGDQLVHLGRLIEHVREEQSAGRREFVAEVKKIERRLDNQDRRIGEIEEAERVRANRLAEVYEMAKKAAEETRRQAHESAEHKGQVIGHISTLEADIRAVAHVNSQQNAHLSSMKTSIESLVSSDSARGERERIAEVTRAEEKRVREEIRAKEKEAGERRDKNLSRLATVISILVVVGPVVFFLLQKLLAPAPAPPAPAATYIVRPSADPPR